LNVQPVLAGKNGKKNNNNDTVLNPLRERSCHSNQSTINHIHYIASPL